MREKEIHIKKNREFTKQRRRGGKRLRGREKKEARPQDYIYIYIGEGHIILNY